MEIFYIYLIDVKEINQGFFRRLRKFLKKNPVPKKR